MTQLDLKGRIALVTGASRGIGHAIALELGRAGAHVIATARTQGGLEELDDAIKAAGGTTSIVPLDLMSPDGIEKLAQIVKDRWGKLDILVAAAGDLGTVTPAAQVQPKTWNSTFGVNVIAPTRMIRAFEALLFESDAPRVLFISSGAAESRRPYFAPYAASKAALDALVQSWAKEHEQTALKANLLYPGPMRTAMRKKAFPGEDPMMVPPPEEVWETVAPLFAPDCEQTGEIVRHKSKMLA